MSHRSTSPLRTKRRTALAAAAVVGLLLLSGGGSWADDDAGGAIPPGDIDGNSNNGKIAFLTVNKEAFDQDGHEVLVPDWQFDVEVKHAGSITVTTGQPISITNTTGADIWITENLPQGSELKSASCESIDADEKGNPEPGAEWQLITNTKLLDNGIHLVQGTTGSPRSIVCTVTNMVPSASDETELYLAKHVVGDADPDNWNLTASWDGGSYEGEGSEEPASVVDMGDARTFTLGEELNNDELEGKYKPIGWKCTDQMGGNVTVTPPGQDLATAEVTIEDGKQVTCRLTNEYTGSVEPPTAQLTLSKEFTAEPGDLGDWTLAATGDSDPIEFSAADPQPTPVPGDAAYLLTEKYDGANPTHRLARWECHVNGGRDDIAVGDDDGWSVSILADQVVSCTAYNEPIPAQAPTFAIGGIAWIDADADGVKSPTEKPAAGVVLQLNGPAAPAGSAVTDASGHYLFDKLPAGTYQVQVTTPPAGHVLTRYRAGTGDVSQFLQATATTADIVLAPSSGLDPVAGLQHAGRTIEAAEGTLTQHAGFYAETLMDTGSSTAASPPSVYQMQGGGPDGTLPFTGADGWLTLVCLSAFILGAGFVIVGIVRLRTARR